MGEAKRRVDAGYVLPKATPVRVVNMVALHNDEGNGVTMLLLGAKQPELAAPMKPDEARKLAAELIRHAEALELAAPRILVPGGLIHA